MRCDLLRIHGTHFRHFTPLWAHRRWPLLQSAAGIQQIDRILDGVQLCQS